MIPIANPESVLESSDRSPDRELALEHLLLRLRPINRALKMAAEFRAAIGAKLVRPDVRQTYVTEQHVQQLFAEDRQAGRGGRPLPCDLELTAGESHREDQLRDRARSQGLMLAARRHGASIRLSPSRSRRCWSVPPHS